MFCATPCSTLNRAKKIGAWMRIGRHEDKRVGTGLPVQLHHLLRLAFLVAGVLLLDLLHLRLDQLQVALRLDLLDEQRDQQRSG